MTTRRTFRTDGVGVVYGWLLTRGLLLLAMVTIGAGTRTDVAYYYDALQRLPDLGIGGSLVEYPVPAAALLGLPGLLGDSLAAYADQFLLVMAVLDALLLVLLFRAEGSRRGAATTFWLLFAPLVGPIMFNRFDLVPAVMVAAAVLIAARRPAVAGALVAIGAAVKLWPALLAPALLARRAGRGRAALGFVVAGGVLAVTSFVAAGWDRLTSPLTWQADRGLQLESVWATPLVAADALGIGGIDREFTSFNAWEIVGRGTGPMVVLADAATILGFVAIAALSIRAFRSQVPGPESLALLVIAITAIVIVTNKTFSPQYLIWLGGAVAAALAVASSRDVIVALRRLGVLTLVMAGLGQILFPTIYPWLLDLRGPWHLAGAALLLATRNVLLIAFTVLVVRAAWRATARQSQTPTSTV